MSTGKLFFSKLDEDLFNGTQKIKKFRPNVIKIRFKTFLEANLFVSINEKFPNNWIFYIPNFKLYRTEVIKNVDHSLSIDDIREILSWTNNSFLLMSKD